jgi:hypothetical protein
MTEMIGGCGDDNGVPDLSKSDCYLELPLGALSAAVSPVAFR